MSLRALPMLALVACNLEAYPWQTGGTSGAVSTTGAATSTGSSTSTDGSTAATGTASTTDADPTAADPTLSFIMRPDGGHPAAECDQWMQNCPEGQKCMPYSSDGDSAWDSLKCVDVVPDPAGLYEPCTAGPVATGEDTCDKGLMCWDGQCIAMCIGSPDAPGCADPDAFCPVYGDGTLTLCFPQCDPLAQDCPAGERCEVLQVGFVCVDHPFQPPAALFGPCDFYDLGACEPGLYCAQPELAVECDVKVGCCLPFCDLDDPDTCPGEGQECLPWYDDPSEAASFNTDVGRCALPMP